MSVILTKLLVLALVGILMIGMVTPQPVYGQGGLLSGITGILNGLNGAAAALQNFVNNVMRPILESMRTASSAIQNILGALEEGQGLRDDLDHRDERELPEDHHPQAGV